MNQIIVVPFLNTITISVKWLQSIMIFMLSNSQRLVASNQQNLSSLIHLASLLIIYFCNSKISTKFIDFVATTDCKYSDGYYSTTIINASYSPTSLHPMANVYVMFHLSALLRLSCL